MNDEIMNDEICIYQPCKGHAMDGVCWYHWLYEDVFVHTDCISCNLDANNDEDLSDEE